ncbi:MAG TPA: DUF4129 domain-containing protein [Gaiellaceae bacterium]|nr:DUF4129 domain-containing protein [Gaiellaceae bacterium]
MRGSSPSARAGLVGLGVVGLLAVVALASRGHLGGGGSGAGPSQSVLNWAFSVFFVVYVAAIPFVAWAYFVQRRNATQLHGTGRRGSRFLVNAAVFFLFLAVAVGIQRLREAHGTPLHVNVPAAAAKRSSKPGQKVVQPPPRFRWPVVVVAAVLTAGAAGAYVVARRRKGPLRELRVAEELTLTLDDAIADVRAETDPRRAVIKAYARMEAVLAAHGLPRRPSEAPYEYLARALQELEASAASVGRLTDLFERAKFSLHEIDAAMRADAIGALTAVRDELRTA